MGFYSILQYLAQKDPDALSAREAWVGCRGESGEGYRRGREEGSFPLASNWAAKARMSSREAVSVGGGVGGLVAGAGRVGMSRWSIVSVRRGVDGSKRLFSSVRRSAMSGGSCRSSSSPHPLSVEGLCYRR